MFGLFDFIAGIGEAIYSFFEYFISFISDIVYIVQLTGSFLAQLPGMFGFLPSVIVSLLIAGFGIVVVYKVIGREG